MCPAAGLSPLRVGPEDLAASEGGELVKDLGIAGQAKALISAVAKQMPQELRTACSAYEHPQRSRFLDSDEVESQCRAIVGDLLAEVLSARVKGRKDNPLSSNVVMLYLTTEGRTGRCFAAYQLFPKSIQAFRDALESGTAVVAETENPDALKKQVEQLEAELKVNVQAGNATASGEVTAADGQGAEEKAAAAEAASADTKLTAVPKDWNAKEIVGGISQLDDAVLADLAKDDRKTVKAAAKAEVKSRKG